MILCLVNARMEVTQTDSSIDITYRSSRASKDWPQYAIVASQVKMCNLLRMVPMKQGFCYEYVEQTPDHPMHSNNPRGPMTCILH